MKFRIHYSLKTPGRSYLSSIICQSITASLLIVVVTAQTAFANDIFDAIWGQDFKRVAVLLRRHPELIRARDHNGDTPLHIAAELGQIDMVILLLSKGASLKARDTIGRTPLHSAAGACYEKDENSRQKEISQLLILKGADPFVKDMYGDMPIHCAAMHGNYKIVELLVSKGVYIDVRGNCANTPLHYASILEWPDEMADWKDLADKYMKTRLFLISNGADVTARTELGDTPLHYAVDGGNASIEYVKILIAKGADINARNNGGVTPLKLVKNGSGVTKIINSLLRKNGAIE